MAILTFELNSNSTGLALTMLPFFSDVILNIISSVLLFEKQAWFQHAWVACDKPIKQSQDPVELGNHWLAIYSHRRGHGMQGLSGDTNSQLPPGAEHNLSTQNPESLKVSRARIFLYPASQKLSLLDHEIESAT